MRRLSRAIGWRFMFTTWVMYGLDQGGIHSLNDLGRVYFWKYRGLEPSAAARYITYSDLAWNIKLSFALAMEACPIAGYRFKPYVWFWGLLGTAGYLLVRRSLPTLARLSLAPCSRR